MTFFSLFDFSIFSVRRYLEDEFGMPQKHTYIAFNQSPASVGSGRVKKYIFRVGSGRIKLYFGSGRVGLKNI
jgi:hypothetical protein